ncbi:c-type cytochrome [Akkermansiaceae bacterium]|nr:c-type cytochrome [Akkermansiaceae bacterium]MDB4573030.1 c-type cytochrome [Akkermansiaceae bacterium]
MKKKFIPAIALTMFGFAQAEPLVVGYERFHSQAPSAVGGAILFSELGCANCHGESEVVIPRKGPSLENISSRVSRDWVVKFLKNPEAGRKGSTMPHMTHGLAGPEVDAVVSYLGSLGKGLKFKKARHANAERGSALYHEKGCVACHAPTSDFQGPRGSGLTLKSALAISLPDLKEKTTLTVLEHFLNDPSRYRPDGRMPHIPLEKQEIIDISAHLLDYQSSDPREERDLAPWPKVDRDQVARGKSLVARMNCASCHDFPGVEGTKLRPIPPSSSFKSGSCISGEPVKGQPHYHLTAGQRASLVLYLKREQSDTPGFGKGHLTFAAMNCYACHSRGGKGGPGVETDPFFIGDESLGDSGRVPPPLTGIGHKLQHDWLVDVLEGRKDRRVRPYLKTQMPAYPAQAEVLAKWLAKLDAATGAKPIVLQPKDLKAGRTLLGSQGGFNCITCHNWGEQKSLGIPALDLSSLDRRLQPGWFRSYLLDPPAYRPGTLMPSLWPNGHSSLPDILDGDTERQIAALWAFIQKGEGLPTGFPDHRSGRFELTPKDRPIIQRTFFEKTGTKAILVGFPGDIHLAYDGQKSQPSLVWRGRFFDAYDTWFSRFAPFRKPLGKELYPVDHAGLKPARFRGYQIGPRGNPTFLSQPGDQLIEDSYRVEGGQLIRTVKWNQGSPPATAHPAGVNVETAIGNRSKKYIYSWK